MRALAFATALFSALVALLVVSACDTTESPPATYFERAVGPILTTSCTRGPTNAGCHVADARGNALGNLDTTSFAAVNLRRDLLFNYGPYGQPSFLLKAIPPYQIQIQSFDGTKTLVTTDVRHSGGPIFDPTASAFQVLRRWIENGATENNTGIIPRTTERTPCSTLIPSAPGFDRAADPQSADFAVFRDKANAVLTTCASGNCHGTQTADLYLTCGQTPEQVRWNYFAATEYLAQTAEESEILRRPLSPAVGGAYHQGGASFASQDDPGYKTLVEWANAHGPLKKEGLDPNFLFFADRVQPLLVKKGCMMMQCHSPALFHDLRLRGGASGSFSLSASKKNYDLVMHMMALESPDPDASRMIKKNLYRPEVFDGARGILHKGGPLIEDFGRDRATPAACTALAIDYDKADLDKVPLYCMLREMHRRETAARGLAPLSAIVYVKRSIPSGPDRVQDFDVYSPGADLRRVDASLAVNGTVTTTGTHASLTAGCGLTVATADIRRPWVSWDGKKIAFAARASAGEPFAVYEMNADGGACAKHVEINAGPTTGNGLLIHNFDPTYSPPDAQGVSHIVFASTRGNLLDPGPYDYHGPQRTPSDPSKPNANLYVYTPGKPIRQLTHHLNVERQPFFESSGRLIMTVEKREPGFYQLAHRRINFDGADYHPHYAQRGTVGYPQATDPIELPDRNFAGIFSEVGTPHGGGALGIINRSIGIDFQGTDPRDYAIDPTVIDPASPTSVDPAFFLHSLRFYDPASAARVGKPTTGLYASPRPLPDSQLLVSFGAATDVASFDGDYDVYAIDPEGGGKQRLFGDPGSAEVDAVGVYARPPRGIYGSKLDEPNGAAHIDPSSTTAIVTVLDLPALATLLFQNTPTGRLLEADLPYVEVFEDLPPPLDVTSLSEGAAFVAKDRFGLTYAKRRYVGKIPVGRDGSTRFEMPGGFPFLLHLPDTAVSRERNLPRWQKETMTFYPGEVVNFSFKRQFFNGMCGHCHGAVSGRAVDLSVMPDILTGASAVEARGADPLKILPSPAERGQPQGAPATP